LAISNSLIKLMNGNINVHSTKNKGSVFTIVLNDVKYSDGQKINKIAIKKKPVSFDFNNNKVLVVDDIEENRKYLVGALKNTNMVVLEAENGQNALDIARKEKPNLIITDIIMPGMDGFELCSRIKKDDNLKHITIIGNSAAVMSLSKDKIKNSEFDFFIPKPIQLDKLYKVLNKYLSTDDLTEDSHKIPGELETTNKNAPKILTELNGHIYEQWQQLQVHQPIRKVERFANEIQKVGEKYNSESLTVYSRQINSAVKSFDVDLILRYIKKFPIVLKSFKKS